MTGAMWGTSVLSNQVGIGSSSHVFAGVFQQTDLCHRRQMNSDVNKDLTLKAKAKDRTFEGLNRELDI